MGQSTDPNILDLRIVSTPGPFAGPFVRTGQSRLAKSPGRPFPTAAVRPLPDRHLHERSLGKQRCPVQLSFVGYARSDRVVLKHLSDIFVRNRGLRLSFSTSQTHETVWMGKSNDHGPREADELRLSLQDCASFT